MYCVMDELLCMIELLFVTSPQHIIDKKFKVQESPLLLKTLTIKLFVQSTHKCQWKHIRDR